VEAWGSGMAEGFLHYFEGWVIFLICQLLLMGEIWLIERFTQRRSVIEVQQFPMPSAVTPTGRVADAQNNKTLVACLAMLLAGSALVWHVGQREEIQPERSSLKTFPLTLGDWQAKESSLSIEVEQALGFDDYVLADYQQAGSTTGVNFYVAYYASQRKGVSPHSPQVCIPGGGWVISSLNRTSMALADGTPMEAVRIIISKGAEKQLVYYWFEQRGTRVANEYVSKFRLLADAVYLNRTDGALIRLTTPVYSGEAEQDGDKRLQGFVRDLLPQMSRFLPSPPS